MTGARRGVCSAGLVACALALASCRATAPLPPPPAPPVPVEAEKPKHMKFRATAYTVDGRTASGAETRRGIVAADPTVLPLGSRIRVSGAGKYDGDYVVKDTGRKIKGRDIDIFIADDAEAKRFGRKTVTVEVLRRGSGERSTAEQ